MPADHNPPPARSDFVAQVETLFSPSGILSKASNFEYRVQQQRMAVAVATALENQEHLVVEAGTGVGKSLAYLAPAILYAAANKKKAVVSTHTINLQEQLTQKDLPMLEKILPVDFSYTMLKGRANYLCTRRLNRARQQAGGLFTSPEADELERIYEWSRTTTDGSLSDFDTEPNPAVWSHVCSERGLCSPTLCGYRSDFAKEDRVCFFQRARERILSADVVVVNHTLFFTLLGTLEEKPKGGVLFKNDFVIFDEAHQMENVAARHIGLRVSSGQLRFALQRLWNPRTEKGLLATVRKGGAVKVVAELLNEVEHFFSHVETACEELQRRISQSIAGGSEESPAVIARRAWTELRIRHPDLVEDNISLSITRLREAVADLIELTDDKATGQELLECNRGLGELREEVVTFLKQAAEQYVYWVSRGGKTLRNLELNATPIDVAEFLRDRLFGADTSIIMTSATLAVSEAPAESAANSRPNNSGAPPGLAYFVRRVGAESARGLQVGTPFDYERQMKLYVVRKMPDPRDPGYRAALVDWIGHFVTQTHGKAFVLFTNSKLMRDVSESMRPIFDRLGLECYVQGTGTPRSVMLEKFKENVDSVLFGTDSFWTGVDVPGEALSNVIITRLPFAVPDHPLIEAKIENIEARGGNSFGEFSLPEAILKFRQGVGRLIRTKTDTGIVVILDNRVLAKRYGQAFIDALPKCPLEIV